MSILGNRNQPEANPCAGRCTQSVGDYVCATCGRTVEETSDWNALSVEERIRIKAQAKARLAAIRNGAHPSDKALFTNAAIA